MSARRAKVMAPLLAALIAAAPAIAQAWPERAVAQAKTKKKKPRRPAEAEVVAPPPPEVVAPAAVEPAAAAPAEGTPIAAPEAEVAAARTPTVAAPADGWEPVDLEAETAAEAAETAHGGGNPHGGGGPTLNLGLKLFVDLLVDYEVGEEKFEFRPNHTYVFVALQVMDNLQFMFHISDSPVFFELEWAITPALSLKVGKLLLPFGTNEFHHILGGRVDEQSLFLPETWGDFGIGLNHLLVDEALLSLEYSLYVVNGFEGRDAPTISAGDATDNNWFKDVGARVKVGFLHDYQLTLSAYYGRWDADNEHSVLFYAAGVECRRGFIPLPVLDRIRLRAEWGRGELQLPGDNLQQGLTRYAVGRAGVYAELHAPVTELVAVRVRGGRINGDNTVVDDADVVVVEPAILIGTPKLTVTVAYQFTMTPDLDYSATNPRDVLYAKVFLQY